MASRRGRRRRRRRPLGRQRRREEEEEEEELCWWWLWRELGAAGTGASALRKSQTCRTRVFVSAIRIGLGVVSLWKLCYLGNI